MTKELGTTGATSAAAAATSSRDVVDERTNSTRDVVVETSLDHKIANITSEPRKVTPANQVLPALLEIEDLVVNASEKYMEDHDEHQFLFKSPSSIEDRTLTNYSTSTSGRGGYNTTIGTNYYTDAAKALHSLDEDRYRKEIASKFWTDLLPDFEIVRFFEEVAKLGESVDGIVTLQDQDLETEHQHPHVFSGDDTLEYIVVHGEGKKKRDSRADDDDADDHYDMREGEHNNMKKKVLKRKGSMSKQRHKQRDHVVVAEEPDSWNQEKSALEKGSSKMVLILGDRDTPCFVDPDPVLSSLWRGTITALKRVERGENTSPDGIKEGHSEAGDHIQHNKAASSSTRKESKIGNAMELLLEEGSSFAAENGRTKSPEISRVPTLLTFAKTLSLDVAAVTKKFCAPEVPSAGATRNPITSSTASSFSITQVDPAFSFLLPAAREMLLNHAR
eukprot:GSA25T00010264001.1